LRLELPEFRTSTFIPAASVDLIRIAVTDDARHVR
jgi:hypothetical protein